MASSLTEWPGRVLSALDYRKPGYTVDREFLEFGLSRSCQILLREADRTALRRVVGYELGAGHLLHPLRAVLPRRKASYIGLVSSKQQERGARRVAEQLALTHYASFVLLNDPICLPLASSSCDTVLSSFALHEQAAAAARLRLLEEFHRILEPGGQLFLAEPSDEYQPSKIVDEVLDDPKVLLGTPDSIRLASVRRLRKQEEQRVRRMACGELAWLTCAELERNLVAAGFFVTSSKVGARGATQVVSATKGPPRTILIDPVSS